MTTQEFLISATKTLERADVSSARLDCLVLLEDVLESDRAAILAHPETNIRQSKLNELNKKITRRARHTPLAYIRGKAPFYGREFAVNQHVLVPRPETETMVEMLKKLDSGLRWNEVTIVDVGTGSGAISITAKLELPQAQVVATDIDPQALKIARQNAKLLGADIELLQGDLLQPLPATSYRLPTVILANLPYVPERYSINQAAEHEPKHAIFGGKDGLNLYRRFWDQIQNLPTKPSFVLTEALPPQHGDLAAAAKNAGYNLVETQDLIQVFKRA